MQENRLPATRLFISTTDAGKFLPAFINVCRKRNPALHHIFVG